MSAAKRLKGISRHTVFDLIVRLVMDAATPRINKILAMLLPTMLPMAKPLFPPSEAIMFTANSGEEVPKATTVRPITISGILNLLARADEPSISQPAPLINNTNPTAKSR